MDSNDADGNPGVCGSGCCHATVRCPGCQDWDPNQGICVDNDYRCGNHTAEDCLVCNNGTCGSQNSPVCEPGETCESDGTCHGGGGGGSCGAYEVSCPANSWDTECYDDWCDGGGCCQSYDPIVIDVTGDGYSLTSPSAGVAFDMSGTGRKTRVSWTSTGSNNALLALDRNGNGKIDDGTELFSNYTPQPGTGSNRNGYNALAVYDERRNGGNGDGWIDSKDAIYSKLRLWIDRNHNGISEPSELYTLPQKGIKRISLRYEKVKWLDAYSNVFRYRAETIRNDGKEHWAYDVLLHQAK